MTYHIEIAESADKALRRLLKRDQAKIEEKIDALAYDPRPEGVIKLKGYKEPLYRIRHGNYRIVYSIKDDLLLVLVVEIGHRKGIYRDL